MELYHGSYLPIEKPDISFSRNNVDFGRGFYTTPIREQANSWAARFKRKHDRAIVASYEIDMDTVIKEASILTFETYSEEWLDFVIFCRSGKNIGDYDIVIGGIANDKVFDTVQLYIEGLIDKTESIKRLRYDKPNIQYCFHSQQIIDKHLKFLSREEIL